MAEAAAQESGAADGQSPHDLRTPITAIKGYEGDSGRIANTPEKQRHYLEIV